VDHEVRCAARGLAVWAVPRSSGGTALDRARRFRRGSGGSVEGSSIRAAQRVFTGTQPARSERVTAGGQAVLALGSRGEDRRNGCALEPPEFGHSFLIQLSAGRSPAVMVGWRGGLRH
jgi:hypothetical protein